MLEYFLWSLSFVAAVSSYSFPQALEQDVYVVPTYDEANLLSLKVLPDVKLTTAPKKLNFDWGPAIDSSSAIIMDEASGAILWQKNQDAVLPMASITKVMTASVAMDTIEDWDATYEMQPGENALIGASFPANNGEAFTKADILKTALVASANNAAKALAHSTGLPEDDFITAMNAKADELGMESAEYVDPTGLEAGNKSTVQDIALLMRHIQRYDRMMEPMGMATHKMESQGDSARELTVNTTNRLIKNAEPDIIAGKTGFTYEAGHCLATIAERDGRRIVTVVLGGPDETSRFEETTELVNWAYENYQWPN